MNARAFRRPESVLVIIHDDNARVLLLRRADLGFWQSVTGSLDAGEDDPRQAASREIAEETGLDVPPATLRDWRVEHHFRILPELASRFAPGTTSNTEHLFSLAVGPGRAVRADPAEHDRIGWFDAGEALAMSWSWSNRLAIRRVLGVDPDHDPRRFLGDGHSA